MKRTLSRFYKQHKKCLKCKIRIIQDSSTYCNKCKCKGNRHPFFGKKRLEISGRNHPMFGKAPSWKMIEYNGIKMRSSWEVKYAKYLDLKKIKWLYEFKTFDLGNTTYTPDFYLPETNEYIEIKGWWRPQSKEKFEIFKNRYPEIKIKVIQKVG